MASTYSDLKFELIGTGEQSGVWGTTTNDNIGTAIEQALVGFGNPIFTTDANLTISLTNTVALQTARALVLNATSSGSLTATRELVVPTIEKQYIVQNNTTGGQSITVKTTAGTGITITNGRKAHLYVDGVNVIQMFDFVDINGGAVDGTPIGASSASTGAFTTLAASGAVTLSGGTANGVAYLNGSKVLTSGSALTFDGTKVINGDGSGSVSEFRTSTTNAAGAGGFLRGYRNASPTYYVGDAAPITGSAGDGFVTYVYGNNPAITYINGSEQMRLTSTGLGIGTSSPARKLQVVGTAAVSSDFYGGYANTTANIIASSSVANGGAGFSQFLFGNTSSETRGYFSYTHASDSLLIGTTGTTKATLDSSGNLGLGVTPSAYIGASGVNGKSLQGDSFIIGSGAGTDHTSYLTNATRNAYNSTFLYRVSAPATRYDQFSGQHLWFNAPSGTAGNAISFTQAMTLDASGNLLVGVTSANAAGGATFSRSASANFITWINNSAVDGATHASFRTNGTQHGSISTTGSVTTYAVSSDYRLKNITGPITNSGAYIDRLNPVEGTWKADGSTFVGLIAHEVQEASRTFVATGTKDGEEMQGMDYSSAEIIANMLAEIQSLRARVAALESN